MVHVVTQYTDYGTYNQNYFLHINIAIISIKTGEMGSNKSIKRVETIADVSKYFGVSTSNEWTCVVDLSQMAKIDPQPIYINLYCVVCVAEDRNKQQQPRIVFMPPDHFRDLFPNGYTTFEGGCYASINR